MSHYFDPDPVASSQKRAVELHLPEGVLTLTTDSGVFAAARVDAGTRHLLRRAPLPPGEGDLLDLGCGYGPISVALGLRAPGARVWAVDVNRRAVDLARANAEAADLNNVTACAPEEVPADVRFAAIYSNPPIRVGLSTLHPLLLTWLDRLQPDGAAYLVVHRHLGSDLLARWLEAEGYPCRRLASHDGYRILAVQPRQAVGDDV